MTDEKKNVLYHLSISPHIRARHSTTSIMGEVLFALMPAALFSIFYFGIRVLGVIGVCMASAVLAEWIWQKCTKQPITIQDLSACVTGLLLAMNLPWPAVVR